MCEGCFAHGRAQYPLPWEHSASPLAFIHTGYLVLTDTRSLFSALPHGRVARAVSFALPSSLLAGLVMLLVDWSFADRPWVEGVPDTRVLLVRGLIAQPLLVLTLLSVITACFHAGATLLGGRAAFACSVRAACYLSALAVVDALGKLVDAIANDGSFALLRGLVTMSVIATYAVRTFTLVGVRRYALTRGRAVALAVFAVLMPVFAGAIVLTLITQ